MRIPAITLDQIKDVVRTEGKTIIAAFDRDIKLVESRLGNVKSKLDAHVKQNEQDFADLHNTIQDLIGGLDKSADQKIEKHCQERHSFATS